MPYKVFFNKKRIFLLTFSFVCLISLFFVTNVQAINLTPTTGNCVAGNTININITAAPVSTADGVQIALSLSGPGQIQFYTGPISSSWDPEVPTCSGGTTFTANSVCADLAKNTGTVTNGESLGTIGLRCTGTGTIMISAFTDNGYLNGVTFTAFGSTAGSYSSTGTLPSTALNATTLSKIILGTFLIISGFSISTLVYKLNNYDKVKVENSLLRKINNN